MNVAEVVARRVRARGLLDSAAFHSDRTWTHREVHSLAARLATVLRERGVRAGARVVLSLVDSPVFVALFLAVARTGAVAVVTNPYLGGAERAELVDRVGPALVVAGGPGGALGSAERWVEPEALVVAADRAAEGAAVDLADDADLYVQFTSGTTGRPKGAVHRHGDLAAYHRAVGEDMLGISAADVTLSVSKMFFAYGFGNSLVYPLFSGSAAVLSPERPTPAAIAELVDRYRVTVLHGVPSAYANLVAETDRKAFGSVRVAVSAGESLPAVVRARAGELLGAPVLNELGSTEVGGAYCAETPADTAADDPADRAPGTIGRPLTGYALQVRDGAGRPCPVDVSGRLWVRGPTVMSRYLDAPDETARVLVDGWLSTNDTGFRRADGRFVHTGRADDMEIVGGINVSPQEVEAVLGEHPAVREIVVAAVLDARGASKLRAFAVSTAAADRHAQLEGELLALARRRLAAFKVPRSITFVPALPRTFSGKVQRFVARTGQW
ncbi:class I adenylate-forming enzyme family protein [Pseudonocardia sp. WMMC193]|uniref:class I adenylate-forming enzyme family protein n=1 Tax=Pseudonocardia sp. WMMC193 TaxID=2911965 RepID=UPI001F2BAB84|nr:AMP-binding protein [Pseudonocardia sp. WMMC193]MCF7549497.1 AMP-binding protein [Pseudonocardia sp. WMMC193]